MANIKDITTPLKESAVFKFISNNKRNEWLLAFLALIFTPILFIIAGVLKLKEYIKQGLESVFGGDVVKDDEKGIDELTNSLKEGLKTFARIH